MVGGEGAEVGRLYVVRKIIITKRQIEVLLLYDAGADVVAAAGVAAFVTGAERFFC